MNRSRWSLDPTLPAGLFLALLFMTIAAGASRAESAAKADARVVFPRRPAPSPDGRAIAFSYQGDIWVAPSEGGAARRLTVNPAYETDPVWSPDGARLAFSSERDGNPDVFVLPIDGGEVQRLTWHSTWDAPCGWTNDGSGVLFNSARQILDVGASGLYIVPAAGGTPAAVFSTGAADGELSPDGARMIYFRNGESWWRRGYTGNARSRLWLYTSPPERPLGGLLSDWCAGGTVPRPASVPPLAEFVCTNAGLLRDAAIVQGGDHTLQNPTPQVTDSVMIEDGASRDAHWLPDGRHVLYLAESNGVANVRLLDLERGRRYLLTRFTEGRLRAVNVSRDGTLCAFEYEDGIWTVRVPPPPAAEATEWSDPLPEPHPLAIRLPLDESRADFERLKVTSGADELAVSPDGEQIAFVYRGDVFVMNASKDDPFANNVTRHPARDFQIGWASDSRSLLFVSDRTGNREIWSARSADPSEPRLARALRFDLRQLTQNPEDDARPIYDPAGRRIAFVRGVGRLLTMTADGKDERVISDDWSDLEYRWSPDGRWLAYARNDDESNQDIWIVPADGGAPARNVSQHPTDDYAPRWSADGKLLAFISQRRYLNQTDVWYLRLTRADEELSNLDRTDRLAGAREIKAESIRVRIDFDRIDERAHRLTSFPGNETDVLIAKDGSAFYFVSDTDGKKDLWKVKWDGTEPKRLSTGGVEPSFVQLDAKGAKIYFLKTGGGIASVGTEGGEVTSYAYDGVMTVDRAAERGVVFDEAWRALRDRFYDPALHGADWPALREKYRPWALAASTPRDFQDVVRMMLGELNSSHLNLSGGLETMTSGAATGELGVVLAPDRTPAGGRVVAVVPRTPAEREESRLSPGEKIVAIDGRPLSPTTDLAELLDRTIDRKTRLTVRDGGDHEREVVLRPATLLTFRDALDRQRIDARRRYVEATSAGRLAYLALESMGTEDLEEFERQLYAVAHGKDALVIDVRGNGGGWITDLLLTSLMMPEHAQTVPRGGRPAYPQDRRLLYGWSKPIVLLIDQNSFSNAEIFAWAIKTLHRGPLVGTQTFGGVISTGAMTLLDGSALRLPGRGWYTRYDGSPEEGTGCPPDVEVQNTPDDLARGIDRQLEAAVTEGMKLLE